MAGRDPLVGRAAQAVPADLDGGEVSIVVGAAAEPRVEADAEEQRVHLDHRRRRVGVEVREQRGHLQVDVVGRVGAGLLILGGQRGLERGDRGVDRADDLGGELGALRAPVGPDLLEEREHAGRSIEVGLAVGDRPEHRVRHTLGVAFEVSQRGWDHAVAWARVDDWVGAHASRDAAQTQEDRNA